MQPEQNEQSWAAQGWEQPQDWPRPAGTPQEWARPAGTPQEWARPAEPPQERAHPAAGIAWSQLAAYSPADVAAAPRPAPAAPQRQGPSAGPDHPTAIPSAPGGWLPPGDGPRSQPWMVQFQSQPPAALPRRRNPWKAVAVGVVALAAVLGAGAAGVNAYAKHTVCSAVRSLSPAATGDDGGMPSEAELTRMRQDAGRWRGYGRLLIFSGALRGAVDGLADDEDQLVDLMRTATAAAPAGDAAGRRELARLMTVIGSVNSHARAAQEGCGLPVTGILDS